MSGVEIALAIVLGLIVNEFTDLSPWIARKLVVWSAKLRYGDSARGDIRAEELTAVVNDRPGKLFKLGTGVRFATAALAMRLRRFVARESPPTDDRLGEDLLAAPPLLDDEPTVLVARYMFPTERYRGEWKRHWIHLVKGLSVITIYGVLGVWAAVERVTSRYTGWVVAMIIVATGLLASWRIVAWYFERFVITNKRLMSTEGVFYRRVAMIPLLRVTDMRYVQSPLGRLLNYGVFRLESASRRNAMRRIVDLPNPNELYLRLVEEMYEPAAVEARLGHDEDDTVEAATTEIEIIDHLGELNAHLDALAMAIQRLKPSADEPPTASSADAVPDAELPDASAAQPSSEQRLVRPRIAAVQPEAVDGEPA